MLSIAPCCKLLAQLPLAARCCFDAHSTLARSETRSAFANDRQEDVVDHTLNVLRHRCAHRQQHTKSLSQTSFAVRIVTAQDLALVDPHVNYLTLPAKIVTLSSLCRLSPVLCQFSSLTGRCFQFRSRPRARARFLDFSLAAHKPELEKRLLAERPLHRALKLQAKKEKSAHLADLAYCEAKQVELEQLRRDAVEVCVDRSDCASDCAADQVPFAGATRKPHHLIKLRHALDDDEPFPPADAAKRNV